MISTRHISNLHFSIGSLEEGVSVPHSVVVNKDASEAVSSALVSVMFLRVLLMFCIVGLIWFEVVERVMYPPLVRSLVGTPLGLVKMWEEEGDGEEEDGERDDISAAWSGTFSHLCTLIQTARRSNPEISGNSRITQQV